MKKLNLIASASLLALASTAATAGTFSENVDRHYNNNVHHISAEATESHAGASLQSHTELRDKRLER